MPDDHDDPVVSPTETRAPVLPGDGLSESFQSTDTVRRLGYGTVSSQAPSYFSDITSPTTDRTQHRPPAPPLSGSTRSPLLGPSDRGRGRPRKPTLSRRPSSTAQTRRGIFSIDDAASEVEADEAERHLVSGSRRRAPGGQSLRGLHISQTSDFDDVDNDNDNSGLMPTPASLRPLGTPRDAPAGMAEVDRDERDDLNQLDPLDDDIHVGLAGGIDGDNDDDDVDDMDARGRLDSSDNNQPDGDDDDDDDGDLSDAESFTLKDRQQAINQTHPFGIRLWKPALYKKDRSVQKTAEGDIHSTPGGHVSNWVLFFNVVWTVCFGSWLALLAFSGAVVCLLFAAAPSGRQYGRVLWGLSRYLFYPFGKFVRLEQQEPYLDEDQGEGRSISEYEQWQNGDLEYGRLFFGPESSRSIVGRSRRSLDSEPDETDSLLDRRTGGPGPSRQPYRDSRHGGHGGHGDNDMDDDMDNDDNDSDGDLPRMKRRLFGRGKWNIGRVIFFLFFYLLITPSLFVVSGICWFLVFWIPMGRVTMLLFDHLRRHPLALLFESDIASARAPAAPQSSIIVCTYRSVGLKYWKYTVDGTNIFLINLMAVVLFVIVDWLVLDRILHVENVLTSSAFLFVAGLLSIIPLAYFIGQAVASISAQSSMGVGAAINAFFSTIVEVFLYCVALQQGKARLVEGSIIGSIFAGVLFLPGLSMCFGAIKRKTQRFNARSAGVTSTMLLFAVIAAFSPTLFYQIYGTHELNCLDCVESVGGGSGGGGFNVPEGRDCRRCYFSQTPAIDDRFYIEAVRPYCYFAATLLFLSYIIGLWFTLRTHAAVIWNSEVDEKRHDEHPHPPHQPHQPHQQMTSSLTAPLSAPLSASLAPPTPSMRQHAQADSTAVDIRDSHLYRRILGQSLKQVGLQPRQDSGATATTSASTTSSATLHAVPPKSGDGAASMRIPGFTEAENNSLARQVVEMAATAATIAARDAREMRETRETGRDYLRLVRRASAQTTQTTGGGGGGGAGKTPTMRTATSVGPVLVEHEEEVGASGVASGAAAAAAAAAATAAASAGDHGGHDAPNWSRLKSSVILMGATALYAVIAEILVDSVDFVLEGFSVSEKFLGISLFALVPNTTEFLNAISFAMNGNIALSMEIGSAYALQVCLLQIPALVLFSAVFPHVGPDVAHHTFSLLFPQWDMISVILCVFLLSYMYGEGKSNYFKGSILLLSYLVVVLGFWFSGYTGAMDAEADGGGWGMRRFDTLGRDGQYRSYGKSFKTVGQGRSGAAFS